MEKLLGSQGVLRGKPLRTPVNGAQDDRMGVFRSSLTVLSF